MERVAVKSAMSEEDGLRAAVYKLLATYLISHPNEEALSAARALSGDESPLGKAFSDFAHIAGKLSETEVADEYDALFIGLGRGELLPYASYYLTGFLNEKPLARLRNDMNALGITRQDGVSEPEDHIGFLMEMMAGLISGHYGESASIARQHEFFTAHIEPWAEHFFKDLEIAQHSYFYKPVGTIGQLLMEIERDAFAMQ